MNDLYKLGEFDIDVRRRQIRRDGTLVPLSQKPFEVLLALIAAEGVVTKEELMKTIWPGAFVEESNLTQSVFLLRKALTDTASGSRYIVTLPGVGYQLGVSPVAAGAQNPISLASPTVSPAGAAEQPLPEVHPRDPRRGYFAVAGTLLLATMIVAGWGVWRVLRRAPFSSFSMRRLTNSGDIQLTAISLSGKYAAFVAKNAQGRESLSVLDVRSGNSQVILDHAGIVFDDITFSPDDSYLYYRSQAKQGHAERASEYRIPVLGGEPALVVEDIDGPVAFVDGSARVCFWRGSGPSQFAILSADADSGRDERTLAKGVGSLPFTAVCSPDGQRAALSSEVGGITILDFKIGQRRPFYESPESKELYPNVSWKADGSGLLADAITALSFHPSLISISYPGGLRTEITHDLNSYSSPGMTADGSMIVARQGDANTHFESFGFPLLADNPEVVSFPWSSFLGWRSDEAIVGSTTSGGMKLKNLATGQETSIPASAGMQFLQPNGCGTSWLVASGGQTRDKDLSVWRMSADGSNLKKLSQGPEDILAVCTPDAKWVVYADNSTRGEAAIYRVLADGGPVQKIGEGSVWFAVSHHDDRVAWFKDTDGRQTLVLAEIGSGRQTGSLPIPATVRAVRSLTFAPDDKRVFFIARGEASDSIYELPLDGSAATKQIEFRGAHLSALMVSPGGKYLGAVTAKPVSDAVLLEQHSR